MDRVGNVGNMSCLINVRVQLSLPQKSGERCLSCLAPPYRPNKPLLSTVHLMDVISLNLVFDAIYPADLDTDSEIGNQGIAKNLLSY